MRLSIVIAVKDSPEVVRRQLIHFHDMPLPDDVELILVDNDSTPPLHSHSFPVCPMNYRIVEFHHEAIWVQPAARNFGVKQAIGEWILCTDIDHILTKKLIDFVLNTEKDVVRFQREVAILDEEGRFDQSVEALVKYEFNRPRERLEAGHFRVSPHTNSFAMSKALYLKLGGVSERKVGSGKYPNREEVPLKRGYKRLAQAGAIQLVSDDERPHIYVIPNGRHCKDGSDPDYNPFGLFHGMKRSHQV